MSTQTLQGRTPENVRQFSVFTANRLGRLHELISVLSTHGVDVLALTVLDATDSAIIRFVVDDPEKTRLQLQQRGFPYTEQELLAVEVASATQLAQLMATFLEAEVNINYIYSFIPHPHEKSLLALCMEDNEIAEQILRRHGYRVLKQADISR